MSSADGVPAVSGRPLCLEAAWARTYQRAAGVAPFSAGRAARSRCPRRSLTGESGCCAVLHLRRADLPSAPPDADFERLAANAVLAMTVEALVRLGSLP